MSALTEDFERSGQAAAQTGAVAAPIELESFIEAVTRGIDRSLAARAEGNGFLRVDQPDESTVPLIPRPAASRPPIMVGLLVPPPAGRRYPGNPDDTVTSKAGR